MAEIVDVSWRNVDDIPASLEKLASKIRLGELGTITSGAGVFLTDGGDIRVAGWGRDGEGVHSIGLFTMAANWLSVHRVER